MSATVMLATADGRLPSLKARSRQAETVLHGAGDGQGMKRSTKRKVAKAVKATKKALGKAAHATAKASKAKAKRAAKATRKDRKRLGKDVEKVAHDVVDTVATALRS